MLSHLLGQAILCHHLLQGHQTRFLFFQYPHIRMHQERIVGFITSHSKINRNQLLELMNKTDELANDIGSVIYGQEAVELGLIDAVGTLSDALDYLKGLN